MQFVFGPDWQLDFTWTIYVGFVLSFLVAFGLGANDCANSYGTVVGANVLKLYQAYILATFFELLGAGLLGYKVTETMRKIVNVEIYNESVNSTTGLGCLNQTNSSDGDCVNYTDPDFFLGGLGALAGTAFWLIVATLLLLPVSTTHSAVGATVGFSLVLRGTEGIKWSTIIRIVISWVASPVAAGIISISFYLFIKYTVLVREDSFEASLRMLPFFFFFTISVNLFSSIFEGSKYLHFDELPWWAVLIISVGIAGIIALTVLLWGKDFLRRRVMAHAEEKVLKNPEDTQLSDEVSQVKSRGSSKSSPRLHEMKKMSSKVSPTSDEKIPNSVKQGHHDDQGPTTSSLQRKPRSQKEASAKSTTEEQPSNLDLCLKSLKSPTHEYPLCSEVFTYLQVMSACFLSFSHGSNDTANAVGPLVGMWLTYKTGNAADDTGQDGVLQGLIMFGAVSMIVGLWILGHKVIKTIGTKITHVTPPSGFAMELGTAFTVLVCSKIGIPISTTHCAVGAVVCVGWIKSSGTGVSWKTFGNIAGAWVLTLPVSAGISALVTYILTLIVFHTK